MRATAILAAITLVTVALASSAQEPRTFTDPRDGRAYRTVTIGAQIWMAENLAYKKGDWYEYGWDSDNKKANAAKYGLLYEWKTAKKVCPPGTHLPTNDEWETLIASLGGKDVAGTKMKDSTGWGESGEGMNSSGFSALPGGYRVDNGRFDQIGEGAHWWTATESDEYTAWNWALLKGVKHISPGAYGKTAGGAFSVRCVVDRFPSPDSIRGGCAGCAR